ncbi:MAG: hypothetical protein K0R51_1153 [Cytophagaceae bacterium]|jgi:hypothetical protein|nr:hypothetical protein [Cytophagaceae bacterium]
MSSLGFFNALKMVFVFISVALIMSCESPQKEHTTVLDSVTTLVSDSSSMIDAKNITEQLNSENESIVLDESEMALRFIVSIAEGYDYDSIHHVAVKAAQFLNYSLDTAGSYYNKQQKSIVLSEDNEDDIWAGEYMFRRYGEQKVSIEMRYAYTDTIIKHNEVLKAQLRRDTTRLFVCADVTNEAEATRLQKKLLSEFPHTKIIAAEIYMGCMH